MYNIFGMQVVHALRGLAGHVDEVQHGQRRLQHVQVLVQGRALAPLRHYRQRGFGHAAHEQQDVTVSSLTEDCYLLVDR